MLITRVPHLTERLYIDTLDASDGAIMSFLVKGE
jgi:hypothetical protein